MAVIALVLGMMTLTRYPPVFILLGGLTLLLVTGVVEPRDALSAGLANEGVATIAVLFVVAAGLRDTGGLSLLTEKMLGRPHSLFGAQARLMLPVAVMSGFMNNTPLVAMLMPQVSDWARRLQLSVSKLMMPLSYASILGGACTLIGTSTNLIVNGWLIEEGYSPLGMFEMAWVGLPVVVLGFFYVLTVGRWLLPDRLPPISPTADPREYTVEMLVEPGSVLAGKTIEEAGLRHLAGLYLMEIDRDGQVLAAVSSNVQLKENDRLVLVGLIESVVDLQKIRGLKPATDQVYKIDEQRTNRALVEAVVSDTCPLVGQTIREGKFRSRYNAAVIAVARNGARVDRKIGDIRLRPGDTLLLEARAAFEAQQRNSRDFYLVSRIEGSTPVNHERAPLALLILVAMIAAVAVGGASMLVSAMVAAGLMILTGCCRGSTARAAVDLQVLLVIAAALGIGKSIETSGLDDILGTRTINLVGIHPQLGLVVVFAVTSLLAGLITAKSAVIIVLPIARVIAQRLGVDFMPFVMTVLIAAATTVATPIGYPTNLMVMGPGGYRFRDYMVVGAPLTLLIGIVAMVVIPVVWPFA